MMATTDFLTGLSIATCFSRRVVPTGFLDSTFNQMQNGTSIGSTLAGRTTAECPKATGIGFRRTVHGMNARELIQLGIHNPIV